jgi:hypothetical protein
MDLRYDEAFFTAMESACNRTSVCNLRSVMAVCFLTR